MTWLRMLSLYSYSRKMDRALASFDGGRLRGLHFLDLGASSLAARVPVELGWVRGHPELVGLLLAGVWPRGLSRRGGTCAGRLARSGLA
jgi:hypothetical protein